MNPIHIRYSYSVSSTPLDIKSICDKNSNDNAQFYQKWNDEFSNSLKALPPNFMRRYNQIILDTDIGEEAICTNNLRTGVSVVKFNLAAETVTQIEKKLRYSTADYLSSMGRFAYITKLHHRFIF